MKFLQMPETKIELIVMASFVALTSAFATNQAGPILGFFLGIFVGVLQLTIAKVVKVAYKLFKDRRILYPVREFIKEPKYREGILVSPAQYNEVLISLLDIANKRFNAICTILPTEFLSHTRYIDKQKEKSDNMQDKKRLIVREKEELKVDSRLEEFVDWHLERKFKLYWMPSGNFTCTKDEFSKGEIPFDPDDLIVYNGCVLNGERYVKDNVVEFFRIKYIDEAKSLKRCLEFFDLCCQNGHEINDFSEFLNRLSSDQ